MNLEVEEVFVIVIVIVVIVAIVNKCKSDRKAPSDLDELLDKYGLDSVLWKTIFKKKFDITKPIHLQYLPEEAVAKIILLANSSLEKNALKHIFEETRAKYKLRPETDLVDVKDKAQSNMEAVEKNTSRSDLSKSSPVLDNYTEGQGDVQYDEAKPSEQQVVSDVSAGKILQGLLMATDINRIESGTYQLIKCPQNIRFVSPDMPEKYDTIDITSKEQHAEFNKAITTMGISVATRVAAKGWKSTFEAGVACDIKDKTEQTRSSSNQTMYISKSVYQCIPVHAVRLSVENMQLTNTALVSLQELENLLTQGTATEESLKYIFGFVESFFSRYGSHVNTDVIHLGGIYVQNGTYESEKKITDTKMETMVANVIQSNFSTGFKTLSLAAGVDVNTQYDSSSGKVQKKDGETEMSKIRISITKEGGLPSAVSLEQWKKSLLETKKYLTIIDRGSRFAGVWEILHNHPRDFSYHKGLALFLKYAWHKKYGMVHNFSIDTEEHAHQFIEMILKTKLVWIKDQVRAENSESTLPIFKFIKLCHKVTGEQNVKYREAATKISTMLGEWKPTWVACNPPRCASSGVIGTALKNRGVVVTTVKGNLDDQRVDAVLVPKCVLKTTGGFFDKIFLQITGVRNHKVTVVKDESGKCTYRINTSLWRNSNVVKRLRFVIYDSLVLAHHASLRSIAFPVLRGNTKLPVTKVASIMYQEIGMFVEKHYKTELNDIIIVLKDTESYQAFEQVQEEVQSLMHKQLPDASNDDTDSDGTDSDN